MAAKDKFRALCATVAGELTMRHGFHRKKQRLLVRMDTLWRTILLDPKKWSDDHSYGFNITLGLGLPDLAPARSVVGDWDVTVDQAPLDPMRQRFELNPESDVQGMVEHVVLPAIKHGMGNFLMKYQTPADLYRLVAHDWDTMDKLQAWPRTPIRRVERAAIYACYLGLDHELAGLLERLPAAARATQADHLLPEVYETIEKQGRASTHH